MEARAATAAAQSTQPKNSAPGARIRKKRAKAEPFGENQPARVSSFPLRFFRRSFPARRSLLRPSRLPDASPAILPRASVPRRSGIATITRCTPLCRAKPTRCDATDSRVSSPSIFPVHPTTSIPRVERCRRPFNQSLRTLSGAQHVNPLPQERLLHHPAISPAPARQSERQNDKSQQSRTISRHKTGKHEADCGKRERHEAHAPAECVYSAPSSHPSWRNRRGLTSETAAAQPPVTARILRYPPSTLSSNPAILAPQHACPGRTKTKRSEPQPPAEPACAADNKL